jgi:hypothetical protein
MLLGCICKKKANKKKSQQESKMENLESMLMRLVLQAGAQAQPRAVVAGPRGFFGRREGALLSIEHNSHDGSAGNATYDDPDSIMDEVSSSRMLSFNP